MDVKDKMGVMSLLLAEGTPGSRLLSKLRIEVQMFY